MTGIQIDSDIYDTYIFSGDTSRITLFLKNIYERFTDLEISLEMLESRQIGRPVDENAANSTLCQISYYFREYPKYPPFAKSHSMHKSSGCPEAEFSHHVKVSCFLTAQKSETCQSLTLVTGSTGLSVRHQC